MLEKNLGGYTALRKIDEKEAALFAKTVHLMGVDYNPLAVATQIVSGTNYRYLCEATAVVLDPVSYNVLVTIYSPLQGEATVTEIKKVVVE